MGKIRANQKLVMASVLFAAAVLLFTRMDYIVNVVLYHFGLRFSDAWFNDYTPVYSLLYQFAILCLFLFCRKVSFLLVTEVFVLSSTQDIVFFALWDHGVFPSGQWTWTRYYHLFGVWTTQDQIVLSAVGLSAAVIAVIIVSRWQKTRRRESKGKQHSQ